MNLCKKILILIETAYHLKNKKTYNELVEERSSEFKNPEEIINPDNLIYIYETERISLKGFRNYQNLIELFKHLRDGNNVSPREVLKVKLTLNQI